MSRLSQVIKNPNDVGTLFSGSSGSKEFFYQLSRLAHGASARGRHSAAAMDATSASVAIEDDLGYLQFTPERDNLLDRALATAEKILESSDVEALTKAAKKPFLVSINADPDSESHWPIFEFALSGPIIGPITEYLGILPILTGAHIWYSPNKMFESGRSQEFHLDAEDARQIKLFVLLGDVDADSGPLTGIDAAASQSIYDTLRSKGTIRRMGEKIPDPTIFDLLDKMGRKPIAFTGKAGDLVFMDTCRCFHYGSRPTGANSKPRRVMMFHFVRPYSYRLPMFGKVTATPRDVGLKKSEERERLEYLFGVRR